MNIKIDGMDELNALLSKMPASVNAAVQKELKTALLDLQGKAQELAPVDTGALRGSAKSDATINGFNQIGGYVSFDEPYATRQHEELDYNHPKGGQAKYLQQPLQGNIQKYISGIGDKTRKAVDHK